MRDEYNSLLKKNRLFKTQLESYNKSLSETETETETGPETSEVKLIIEELKKNEEKKSELEKSFFNRRRGDVNMDMSEKKACVPEYRTVCIECDKLTKQRDDLIFKNL
jgi:hypothetical protein